MRSGAAIAGSSFLPASFVVNGPARNMASVISCMPRHPHLITPHQCASQPAQTSRHTACCDCRNGGGRFMPGPLKTKGLGMPGMLSGGV